MLRGVGAAGALRAEQRAVQLEEAVLEGRGEGSRDHGRIFRRAFVQVVHVLRHQRDARLRAHPARDGQVRRVRPALRHQSAAPAVPFPHQPRVARERLGRRQLLGPELLPQPARATESWHAALSADAGAGQNDDARRPGEQRARLFDLVPHRRIHPGAFPPRPAGQACPAASPIVGRTTRLYAIISTVVSRPAPATTYHIRCGCFTTSPKWCSSAPAVGPLIR